MKAPFDSHDLLQKQSDYPTKTKGAKSIIKGNNLDREVIQRHSTEVENEKARFSVSPDLK